MQRKEMTPSERAVYQHRIETVLLHIRLLKYRKGSEEEVRALGWYVEDVAALLARVPDAGEEVGK
jgi:hypothetical protein